MKIAIGAGHGGFGVTPGKRTPDGSLYEWEFNAAVVTKLIAKLKTCKNVEILRLDDPTGKTDVPLKTRTDKANAWGADVYYSQHANAYGSAWNDAHGVETFTYITKPTEAVAFAKVVQSHVVNVTGLADRGVKASDLHVLRESNMTAILNEGPFMTNKEEAKLLKSNTFREAYAEAVFQAFVSFFKLKRKETTSNKLTEETTERYMFKTGWFRDDMPGLARLEKFLKDNGWDYTKVKEDKKGKEPYNRYMFKTGWFRSGTEGLSKMESFLKQNGWDYTKVKENKVEPKKDRYMFKTGWFQEGSKGLEEMEKFLKDHGWDYTKVKEK